MLTAGCLQGFCFIEIEMFETVKTFETFEKRVNVNMSHCHIVVISLATMSHISYRYSRLKQPT